MAITLTNLTGNVSSTTASSYTTASISPGANKLILASVYSRIATGTSNDPSLSGNGITWVKINSVAGGLGTNRRVWIYRGLVASPSAGAVTIDFGGQDQTNCIWSITEVDGIDTSGTNGSGAIVQSQTNTGSATSLTITLNALASANNVAFGAISHQASQSVTPGDGFTEIDELRITSGSTNTLQTEYKLNETAVSASWTLSKECGGVALELKMVSATGGFMTTNRGFWGA